MFAVRQDDLARVRQLMDCVWFVDTSTPTDGALLAELVAATKAARFNRAASAAARADGAAAGGSAAVSAAKAAADAAMADLP